MHILKHIKSRKQQQGAALVISLIMLVIITLIGISAMQSVVLNEKMAGNMQVKTLVSQITNGEIYSQTDVFMDQSKAAALNIAEKAVLKEGAYFNLLKKSSSALVDSVYIQDLTNENNKDPEKKHIVRDMCSGIAIEVECKNFVLTVESKMPKEGGKIKQMVGFGFVGVEEGS